MSELALKLIREAKENRTTSLDLGNCGLTELPEELFELTWLEELKLNGNKDLKDLIALKNLKELQQLYLYSTEVINLTPLKYLFKLKSLT